MTEQEINDHADRLTYTVLQYLDVHVGPMAEKADGRAVLVEVVRRLLKIAEETSDAVVSVIDDYQPSPPASEGEDI